MRLIKLWPRCIAHSGGVAECVPQFFCNVWSERCKQHNEGLQHLLGVAFLLSEFTHCNHKGRNRGVVGEDFDVFGHLFDEFVECLEIVLCGRNISGQELLLFVEEVPKFAQEAETSIDAVAVPRLALIDGTEEHFIKSQGVGTIFLNNEIGIHHIKH